MKTMHCIIVLIAVCCLSACSNENSKPVDNLGITCVLSIVNKQSDNLLLPNLELGENGEQIISPYTLTATCNDRTVKIKNAYYSDWLSSIVFRADLSDFAIKYAEGYASTLIFELQLPTVFEDNRTTEVKVKWKIATNKNSEYFAETEGVFLNGVKIESPNLVEKCPDLTLVVDE